MQVHFNGFLVSLCACILSRCSKYSSLGGLTSDELNYILTDQPEAGSRRRALFIIHVRSSCVDLFIDFPTSTSTITSHFLSNPNVGNGTNHSLIQGVSFYYNLSNSVAHQWSFP